MHANRVSQLRPFLPFSSVGTQSHYLNGGLTWNPNGTLGQLAITDQFNSGNSQTCNYSHDDIVRVASANCGSAAAQTFAYDPFGNIDKAGSPYTFSATYSAPTNRIVCIGGSGSNCSGGIIPTYDANGNVTVDSLHSYSWDADGNSITLDGIGLTFDALDRMVEQNRSGSYRQIVYGPGGGKLALMSSQSLVKAFVSLPGQATAVYAGSGLDHYRHSDWLGGARLTSSTSQAYISSVAYAPYGETYAASGSTDPSFTGDNPDTVSTDYDFLYREYSNEGRWVSPDPAGLNAVDPSSPQSWNRYAYVWNNPCNAVDPVGLDTCTFNIQINNKAGLTDSQEASLEAQINAVLGSANSDGNSVQAQFSVTGKPDFTLNISPKTNNSANGYSGWPFSSPTIYWGNIGAYPNATTYGGTAATHEIVHRGAGPVFDLWGSYNGPPNLMNVNQAQAAGLSPQVSADWSNPNAATGFASLSPLQVQKLYKKCRKKHRGGGGGGGNGGSGGGTPPTWLPIFLTSCGEEGCGSYFAGWLYIPGTWWKGPTL
jgi:RHS repeat-associated protein